MRLFRKNPGTDELQRHLETLSSRLDKLEGLQRALKLEYLETYDKVQRLMSRVSKRAALDRSPPDPDPEEVQDEFSHMDKISAEIMRRRANGME